MATIPATESRCPNCAQPLGEDGTCKNLALCPEARAAVGITATEQRASFTRAESQYGTRKVARYD